ncbi:MAG: hypothetical protein JXB13_16955 [Phycisphaerae bacterium]|nr:hypothetical protein [Phycisphaerae bacterium]
MKNGTTLRTAAAIVAVTTVVLSNAQEERVAGFRDLPPAIRSQVLTGAPRNSDEISHSSFGVLTTLLMERDRDDAEFQDELVDAIAGAGYKWVVDYINSHIIEDAPLEDISPTIEKLLPPMADYAAQLQSHKIDLMVRIDYPRWKTGMQKPMTDDDRARMRAFVAPIVRALSPTCRHWQYYNEPNMGNKSPLADPSAYVDWLRYFRSIVREIQPDAVIAAPAVVMLQCMQEKPYPWLRLAFEAGLAENLDLFTYHPYRARPFWGKALFPEQPSQFSNSAAWSSYYQQIDALKHMIRKHNGGRELPLATTEDGRPNMIGPSGEQHITWVMGAKYELRGMLLDNWLGVNPRTMYSFYRAVHDQFYDRGHSMHMLTADLKKKPSYYATQNLTAVLDSTYERDDTINVDIELASPPASGTAKLIRTELDTAGITPGKMDGLYVQTYTKAHDEFEELLVFFWSAEQAEDRHVRRQATMMLDDPSWIAPLEIDLMAMPNENLAKKQQDREDLINPDNPDRFQPRLVKAQIKGGVITLPVEVRDYPLLIKWVRLPGERGASSNAPRSVGSA